MNNQTLLTAFNDHFVEFVDDIISVFPEDPDILTAKNSFIFFRKTNPKITIYIWNKYVVGNYKDKIEAGDISFFIDKDYSQDLQNLNNSNYSNYSGKIMEAINRLRNPVKLMSEENQKKTMKYIQNLTKISTMYES
jgi:hypothetical protein